MKRIIRLTESDLTRIVRRVINEQVPSWALSQDMNFYDDKSQSGRPYSVTITPNSDEIWKDYDGYVDIPVKSDLFKSLTFSCFKQNSDPGSFYLEYGNFSNKSGETKVVYNKTIAEKYFAPQFCSKNSQGLWVQKVENPDFAANQGGMDKGMA